MEDKRERIVIVGGGASGMTAAIAAAETAPDADIRILEHRDAPGKKLLATGNGRCNFTNESISAGCYHSDTPDFVEKIIGKYDAQWTLGFFERLGIPVKVRNGCCYPRSGQAAAVLRALKLRLKQLGVPVLTKIHVEKITQENQQCEKPQQEKLQQEKLQQEKPQQEKQLREKQQPEKQQFVLHTSRGQMEADRVILACGGKAAAKFGSDGSGYELAEMLGHRIVPVVPALVQLAAAKAHPLAKAAGVRTESKVSVFSDGELLASDTGELQITDYGISGIPVFQVSRHAAKALRQGKSVYVSLDFLPEMEPETSVPFFENRKKGREGLEISDFLNGVFPQKLIPCLLRYAKIRGYEPVSALDPEALRRLARACRDMRLDIADTNGFENAQVCAGGVSLAGIDPDTMGSRLVKGLYFAGEILDADGICGGYNLHWAWASGYIAGRSAAERI